MDGSAGVGRLPARRASRRSATTARPTCANTYLLYLRFQLHARRLDARRSYDEECALLRDTLEKRAEPHWREFLSLWKT